MPSAAARIARFARAPGVEVQRGSFDHRADAAHDLGEAAVAGRRAEQPRAAARRGGEAEQHPDRGRLAGAVWAQQPADRAVRYGEGEVVDGDAIAVVLGEPVTLDDRRARTRSVSGGAVRADAGTGARGSAGRRCGVVVALGAHAVHRAG